MKKIKIQKNKFGNLRGFIGSESVKIFGHAFSGDCEFIAKEWINEMKLKGHEVSSKSYIF